MKTKLQWSAMHWATMNQKDGYCIPQWKKNSDCCHLSNGGQNVPKHWQYSLLVYTLHIHFTSLGICSDSGSQWHQVRVTPPLPPKSMGIMRFNALVAFEFPFWILETFWWCYSIVCNFSGISKKINCCTFWGRIESTRRSFAHCTYHRDCH